MHSSLDHKSEPAKPHKQAINAGSLASSNKSSSVFDKSENYRIVSPRSLSGSPSSNKKRMEQDEEEEKRMLRVESAMKDEGAARWQLAQAAILQNQELGIDLAPKCDARKQS